MLLSQTPQQKSILWYNLTTLYKGRLGILLVCTVQASVLLRISHVCILPWLNGPATKSYRPIVLAGSQSVKRALEECLYLSASCWIGKLYNNAQKRLICWSSIIIQLLIAVHGCKWSHWSHNLMWILHDFCRCLFITLDSKWGHISAYARHVNVLLEGAFYSGEPWEWRKTSTMKLALTSRDNWRIQCQKSTAYWLYSTFSLRAPQ